MEEVWVTFDKNSYSILKEIGYKYFVFVAEGVDNKVYPFKTMDKAIEKLKENPLIPKSNNYIMEINDTLDELASGVPLLYVQVLI